MSERLPLNSSPVGPASTLPPALAALKRLQRPRSSAEHCELCGAELNPAHAHLLDLCTRQLVCSCQACSILFSDPRQNGYRRVPDRRWRLEKFECSDARWQQLAVPIQLAFFTTRSDRPGAVALYPSPAGATEAPLDPIDWQQLIADNPVLGRMDPDVEALLAYRVGQARDWYLAPLDDCYRLTGLIRTQWRGLSGGTQLWREIVSFFAELGGRCQRREAGRA